MSSAAGAFRSLVTAAVLTLSAVAATGVQAATVFDTLNGTWAGRGRASFDNGQSEPLHCSAYYRSLAGGSQLRLSIRCASEATKIDLKATLNSAGGNVNGTWEERTFNAAGNASGTVSGSAIHLTFRGGGLGGNMNVALSHGSHQVSITSTGTALRAVNVSMSRGG